MSLPLFETKNLCFNNVITYQDFAIPADRVTFITGESGCGKTTLFKLLNATISPICGEAFYRGRNIAELDTLTLRQEVSLISQSVYLFDTSIEENFKLFYEYRGQEPPQEATMQKFLDLCCINMSLDKDCATMSGGERQRVYLSIFLSLSPKVLLLDEPTSALDHDTGVAMLENVVGYCKKSGVSLVVISHDRTLTERFSENTITMKGCARDDG